MISAGVLDARDHDDSAHLLVVVDAWEGKADSGGDDVAERAL